MMGQVAVSMDRSKWMQFAIIYLNLSKAESDPSFGNQQTQNQFEIGTNVLKTWSNINFKRGEATAAHLLELVEGAVEDKILYRETIVVLEKVIKGTKYAKS